MYVVQAYHPDHALAVAMSRIVALGVSKPSRNGPVLRFDKPVTTEWLTPMQRVSFSTVRDANPFLHVIESMWMLNGNNDVATMGYYAKQMLQYTDDGETLNGAYGFRWRKHFGYDQLDTVIAELRKNPESRRCVISMWDGSREFYKGEDSWAVKRESDLLNQKSKDLPCNTAIYVDASLGQLDITVTNRSNDMIWGAYGANAVHFAFLQEYIANKLGIPVGTYYQMSNNLHIYTEFDITKRFLSKDEDGYVEVAGALEYPEMYGNRDADPLSLNAASEHFETELHDFVQRCTTQKIAHEGYENPFLNYVAMPMARSYNMHKAGDTEAAIAYLTYMKQCLQLDQPGSQPNDWLTAGILWLNRRLK